MEHVFITSYVRESRCNNIQRNIRIKKLETKLINQYRKSAINHNLIIKFCWISLLMLFYGDSCIVLLFHWETKLSKVVYIKNLFWILKPSINKTQIKTKNSNFQGLNNNTKNNAKKINKLLQFYCWNSNIHYGLSEWTTHGLFQSYEWKSVASNTVALSHK